MKFFSNDRSFFQAFVSVFPGAKWVIKRSFSYRSLFCGLLSIGSFLPSKIKNSWDSSGARLLLLVGDDVAVAAAVAAAVGDGYDDGGAGAGLGALGERQLLKGKR